MLLWSENAVECVDQFCRVTLSFAASLSSTEQGGANQQSYSSEP